MEFLEKLALVLLETLVCQEALPAFALEVLLVPDVVLVVLSLLGGVEFDWIFTTIAYVSFLYFSLTYLLVLLLMPEPLLCMIERLLAVLEAANESAFN